MRLDLFVAEKAGISRTRAQNLIKTGGVSLQGVTLEKPSAEVDSNADITIVDTLKYASLGGLKLESALIACNISVQGKTCLDLGAANGGFTDCMLQMGASSVSAVDVTIVFPRSLASDPRVTLFDGVNVKEISSLFTPESFDFITADLSFISLCGLFATIEPILKNGGIFAALFKPQFEVGRRNLPKSGVVRDKKILEKTFQSFCDAARSAGLTYLCDSPVPAYFPEKNKERTVFFQK